MPKTFQYVCDKCGKTELSEIHDTPEKWWAWCGMYFCAACFGSVRQPVCVAMDALEKYLGDLLTSPDPSRRRRIAASITRDVAEEIWKTLPRPKDDE